MFTGIVEGLGQIHSKVLKEGGATVQISRPPHFDDVKPGDSICCNGVCLTVVKHDEATMTFDMGPETLKVTGWESSMPSRWNLERSLRYGDRIHGHLVTGHVDNMARITGRKMLGDSLELWLEVPVSATQFIVAKGSLCIQGVSLTLNQVQGQKVSVCLIPETLQRTQLGDLAVGDIVTIETDYFLKGLLCTTRQN